MALTGGPSVRSGPVWRRWAGQGVWAVLDQGCFALSNLALGVLLARWLPQRAYGAFAFVFSLFLLFGTVYSALLPEPLLVFGTSRFPAHFPAYLRILLTGHALVMSVGVALFAAAAGVCWLRGAPVMAVAFASWAVAAPCITLSWLLRRACFSRGQPELAAIAGAAQLVLMVTVLAILSATGTITLFTGVSSAAGVSLATSAWLLSRLRGGGTGHAPVEGGARAVFALHWEYGRWAAAGGLLAWVCTYSYYLVLPYWGGLDATAALRALYTLGIPVSHAQTALATLLIPSLVRTRSTRQFDRLLRFGIGGFAAASISGWLVLGLTGRALVHLVYGGRYDAYGYLLWGVAAVPIVAGTCDILRSALRAQERPDQVFWGYGVGAAVTATVGLVLTFRLGVLGPMLGEIASSVAAAIAMGIALRRARRDTPVPVAAS